jgi:hypothetical protein
MVRFLYCALSVAFLSLIIVLWHLNSLKVDYSKLESLLSQKKWIESDLYTEEIVDRLLSKTVDDETFPGFSKLDFFRLKRTNILHLGRLSCEELTRIDDLWTKYSSGSFGFTSQARIALSMRKSLPTLTGQPNFTWDISELEMRLGWHRPGLTYLNVSKWYEPANIPENAIGFLPSERWILRNTGGGKPTYTYSDALKHFIECRGLS